MNKLKAEEARVIANENSELVGKFLDEIYTLISQEAKQGRYRLNYTSEVTRTNLISPIQEILITQGYQVNSLSIKSINLEIKW